MKRLVFILQFCLLITMFIFVATPAIAIVTIKVDSESFVDDDANTPENERKLVVKLTYSVEPNPKPTMDQLAMTPTTSVNTIDGGSDDDPKTYFITWSELSGFEGIKFTLQGYRETEVHGPGVSFYYRETNLFLITHLKLTDNHLPGLGYAIYARNDTDIAADVFPTLPTYAAPNSIVKVAWADMPDLHELFTGGGSLNLRVNAPGTTDRLGSKQADDTYDDDHNRNQRQVVINEVMWAHDESFIGTPDDLIREQWIEIYNRETTPIAFTDIVFTTDKQFPGPKPETDLLSNVPNFRTTWEIAGLGQHGSSETPRREFKSMQRINYTNGWESGHWSMATVSFLRNYRGTPGKANRAAAVPSARRLPGRDNPAINKIIINEIANLSNDESDWIELRNVTDADQSLQDWVLTKTTGFGNESEIIRFPDISVPARSVLLLLNKNPLETSLSMGFDVEIDADNQEFGAGSHQFLTVDDNKLAIPNDDQWLLILRSGKPWDVGSSRNVYQTGHRVEDVVGPGALHADFIVLDIDEPSPSQEKKSDGNPNGEIWHTKVFPLNGNFQDDAEFLESDRLNSAGKVWVRDGSKQGYLKGAWSQASFTGIGYDRRVQKNDQNSGTPGYDSNVVKGKVSQLAGGKLIVSELMLTTGIRSAPQWIELYNTSKTRGIDLAADTSDPKTGWQLIIENHESGSWKESKRNLNITINLKDLFDYIPPKQTVLIVSAIGRSSDRDYYPATRVAGIYEKKPATFSMASRKDLILNAEGGFYIGIVDGDGTVSDEVGNLDGQLPNPRQGVGLDDPFSWNWPTALTENDHRTSLIRLRSSDGRPRVAVPDRSIEGDLTGAVLPMGMEKNRPAGYAWVHAVDTAFKRVPRIWYGDSSDISTPGYIRGTPLPVTLSFFRPTLEHGKVVIRWTTESELDNAGFNILRSASRNGAFKQVNAQLIRGAGTTGTRQTYKWVDTTAKQGVIYYYQIEDVSFAGERQVLTTTRLKGLLSPQNKLATTWSELKSSR